MHPAAWNHDQISWRLLARTDTKSGGRGIFPWANSDVADQFPASRKATSLSDGGRGLGWVPGLMVARQCRSAQAGDIADLTRAGESGDQAVLLGSSCRSRSHGWIPMAADGSVDRWIHPQAGAPQGLLALALRCQNSLPSAGCLAALALCPRLVASALFRRSGRYGHRNLTQAPEHVGSNQRGRGRGWASCFGCLPSTPPSPVQ
jgi:hypothetical protein